MGPRSSESPLVAAARAVRVASSPTFIRYASLQDGADGKRDIAQCGGGTGERRDGCRGRREQLARVVHSGDEPRRSKGPIETQPRGRASRRKGHLAARDGIDVRSRSRGRWVAGRVEVETKNHHHWLSRVVNLKELKLEVGLGYV